MSQLFLFCFFAQAEDIDLFIQPGASEMDLPNILFVVDNTANWNTPFNNEKAALVNSFNNIPVNSDGSAKFRVGIVFANETGNPNNNIAGGYVRAAIRSMTSENKVKYAAMLNNLDVGDDKGNGGYAGLTMAEAYRYFAGGAPYAGNGKVKTDYAGNTASDWKNNTYTPASKAAMQAIYALPGNALSSFNGTQYTSPIPEGYCGANFIIFISNGANQENSNAVKTGNAMLSAAGGSTTTIPLSPSGSQDSPVDEWARFMYQSALKVVTYTVDVDKISTGQGPGWTALLKSAAAVSTGKYFDVSSGSGGAEIADALNQIFSEIQAVNSAFASVSLPVSVNTQGTYLNQVYVGMFRPDALPRWVGNLKQYKMGKVGSTLELQDAASINAINSNTGFITECARSFWTPTSVDTYWSFRPQGDCLAVSNSQSSNYPDGPIVEKGAQAYTLRAMTSRAVKTCAVSSCTVLDDFSATYATQSLLGASSTAERDELINWGKGFDIDTERPGSSTTNMRPSIHGDVLHSRPVAINFSNDDNAPQVVVFYGDNSGVLHAANGNRTANIGTVTPGSELWSFMAPEFFSSIKRLRANSTGIRFHGSDPAETEPKPYGVDGAVTAYRDASNTWIYATMRRGGRVVYAFNVTNPASPSLKWRIGCPNLTNDTGCTTGLEGIGQTWSSPKALNTAGYSGPLLIMGGGYDTCEDADPHTCTSTKGNRIYVLDADTGTLQKTLNTDRAVVGDVFVVTDSTTGLAKWAYASDLGGNLYRISGSSANSPFGTDQPSSWQITKIAALGCNGACAEGTANRKFMFGPDVVEVGNTYAIMIGSGDREKPLTGFTAAYGVSNRFFRVNDNPTTSSDVLEVSDLQAISNPSTAPSTVNANGWYLNLATGEQVVTSSITVFGTTTFSTHTPTVPVAGTCSSNLGTARVYNINFNTAQGTRDTLPPNVGLPPSPIAGMVTLDSGELVPFVIGASPESPLAPSIPPSPPMASSAKSQIYWYIQQ